MVNTGNWSSIVFCVLASIRLGYFGGKVMKGALASIALAFLTAAPVLADQALPYPEPKSPAELPDTALIQTSRGDFEVEFYREVSPIAVRNFEYLVLKNFYDGIKIHRYDPGFVVQMGDPEGNGKGGPGYTIPPEFSKTKHERGTLGMARLPSTTRNGWVALVLRASW